MINQFQGQPGGQRPGAGDQSELEAHLDLRSPADLVAAIPYLLGCRPSDGSLVAVGVGGPRGMVTVRLDLPDPTSSDGDTSEQRKQQAAELADHLTTVLIGNEFTASFLVGYGSGPQVTPVIEVVASILASRGLVVAETLRVHEGRWWSYSCGDPGCCPPEGVPCEDSGRIAAQAVHAGLMAFEDRAQLAATLAPTQGPERERMRAATDRAEKRMRELIGHRSLKQAEEQIIAEGLDLVRHLAERTRHGGHSPTDDQIARLGLLLMHLRVRDEAWARIDPDHLPEHLDFWRQVLRRIHPDYAAAPAVLMAYAASAQGDGLLANLALDRALEADPYYRQAHLLRLAIANGLPPDQIQKLLTPEDLADSDAHRQPGAQSGDRPGSGPGEGW